MEETDKEYGEIEELTAGSGMIAGIGVGPDGEPPGITHAQKKKRKKFAGADVFVVDPKTFMKARFGKKKCANYRRNLIVFFFILIINIILDYSKNYG